MITNIVLTGIIIWLLFVLSDTFDENKLYKDKYKWYSDQYVKARHELSLIQKEIHLMKQAEKTNGKQVTMNVHVDTDEVVSKVMQGVNKKIEDIKKKEQIFIKVDGKEINADKLKEIIRKEGKGNKNIF